MMTTTKTTKLTFISSILIFCLAAWDVHGQSNLKNINQSLRYSRYSRISPKIIPLKTGEREFLLQMPVEKIEEAPNFDDYTFSYVVVEDFEEEITEKNIVPLTASDLAKDTDRHFYFEKSVTIPADQNEAYAVIICKDTRQGDQYVYHTDLISPFIADIPNFGAYYDNDIPFDQTYINKGEALLFKSDQSMNLYQIGRAHV